MTHHHESKTRLLTAAIAAAVAFALAGFTWGFFIGRASTDHSAPCVCDQTDAYEKIHKLEFEVNVLKAHEGKLGHWQCGSGGCMWIGDALPKGCDCKCSGSCCHCGDDPKVTPKTPEVIPMPPVVKQSLTTEPAKPATKLISPCPPLKAKP